MSPPTITLHVRQPGGHSLELTDEELALLRASVAFHARHVTDPVLRAHLERAASKLGRLVPSHQAA